MLVSCFAWHYLREDLREDSVFGAQFDDHSSESSGSSGTLDILSQSTSHAAFNPQPDT